MANHATERASTLALVCDDAGMTTLRLQKLLSDAGYQVVLARDGLEGMEQASALRPDVVFMDVQMPRLDGISALQRIVQAHPVPVIVLTAYADPQTVQRALAAGAAGYLVKPFLDEQVLAALAVARARFDRESDLRHERDSAETHAAASALEAEESWHLVEETRAQLETEREAARALAESFLCPVPDVPGVDIGTWYEPAWRADLVGGDYCDFIPLPENRLGIMLGDVCGKGLSAARVTSQARYI